MDTNPVMLMGLVGSTDVQMTPWVGGGLLPPRSELRTFSNWRILWQKSSCEASCRMENPAWEAHVVVLCINIFGDQF